MFTRWLIRLAVVASVSLAGVNTTSASPVTIDGVGDAFAVSFSGVVNPGGLPVSAVEQWLVTAFDAHSITLQVQLDNTSPTDSRLTAFGFSTSPGIAGGSTTSSLYSHPFTTDGSDGFAICVENDDNNNCFGNRGNVGVTPSDAAHTFLLTLLFDSTAGGVAFGDFFARLQSVGPDNRSAKLYGDGACTAGCDPDVRQPVPEPATIALLGAGGVAAFTRRRRRAHR